MFVLNIWLLGRGRGGGQALSSWHFCQIHTHQKLAFPVITVRLKISTTADSYIMGIKGHMLTPSSHQIFLLYGKLLN